MKKQRVYGRNEKFKQKTLINGQKTIFLKIDDWILGDLQLQQRAALPHLLMALSLVLALTLVLALVRNIIFSTVRVLVLNQPIIHRHSLKHLTSS